MRQITISTRLRTLVAIGALLLAAPAAAQTANSITARGEATVKKTPDQAWVTISTDVHGAKPEDARRTSADVTTALIAGLKTAGVGGDAIQTRAYGLTPNMSYTNGTPKLVDYSARNEIEVRVDDLSKLAGVIDAANAPKNAGLSITGPRFELKNRAAAEEEALEQAVATGVSRAKAMARGSQQSIGAILHIEEEGLSSGGPRPMPMFEARGGVSAPAPTPISAGPIEITASVVVTVAVR